MGRNPATIEDVLAGKSGESAESAIERPAIERAGDAASATPVNPDAIAAARESRAIAEEGKRGRGRPAGSRTRKKTAEEIPPADAPTLDPAAMKAMQDGLVNAYELLLTLAAFAPVRFTPDERPVVGENIVLCVNTYLPAGFSKHMPAAVLAMVTAQAIVRARAEKKEAERVAALEG